MAPNYPDNKNLLSDQELVEAVNRDLESVGSPAQINQKALENTLTRIGDHEELIGKRIVFVDDSQIALFSMVLFFTIATQGQAKYVHHSNQNREELTRNILDQNPDLVMMDYALAVGIKGTEIIERLKAAQPELKIIGFSSMYHDDDFARAGAVTSLHKNPRNIQEILNKVTEIISK